MLWVYDEEVLRLRLIIILQLAVANAAGLFDAKALGLVNLVVAI